MTTPVIIFTVIYCLVLLAYFYTETSGKMYLRAPNKCLLALMFFVFACVVFSTSDSFTLLSFQGLLMAGLFLAMMGDIFLLFDFNRGGDFFLAGNVCFIMYEMALLKLYNVSFAKWWWVILVAVLLVSLYTFLFTKFKDTFKMGKMKFPMILYLSSITMHGLMGIAVMIFIPDMLLMGLGSLLFWISDLILTVDRFVLKSKWSLRANSAFYFTGLLLIVLSMVV
ncbi:MAG: lysoplasmalogenase [Gammaproteobacteria bacterium]|nr:lysoplasmalogenase [Gammaproteobacteria bacterium]